MRLIVIFSLLFIFFSCSERKVSGCAKFLTGSYYFFKKPERTRIVIERDSSNQTEYNPITDTITGYQIKWTSKCEYEVFNTYRTKKTPHDTSEMKAFIDLDKITTVKYRIIEASSDFYICESWEEGRSFIYIDTIWVLKY